MATRGYPVKTNESQALATEIPFGEMQMLTLAHGAFAPLVGALNASTVNLPLVTTIHRLSPGKLTLEGTLSYQLTAARFAQVCGAMLSQTPWGRKRRRRFGVIVTVARRSRRAAEERRGRSAHRGGRDGRSGRTHGGRDAQAHRDASEGKQPEFVPGCRSSSADRRKGITSNVSTKILATMN
ncbi:MAG: hypothetical protein IPJ04_17775 [Candidatus Eisenbacteria bacterium]|nr:hypothetical protein [Candidatus Eisenbacteria bacterium]